MDRWKHRIRARLRSFLRRAAVERELDAELAFHVQQSVAENVAAGMGPNEARALASRAFGSVARTKDQCRESLGLRLIDEIRQDVLYAVRWLLKNWAFTLVAVLTLALGTGANTTIFSTIDALLIRPLPYHDPDRLVMVWEDATAAGFPRNTPAPGNYSEWTRLNRSFEALAATRSATTNLTLDGPPEQIVGRAVTANFFAVLGTPPLVGRTFSTDEDRSRAPVVIISYALWQRRYNGDPSILNRTLLMDDNRHEIIGVMPKPFVFLNRDVDYWVPIHFSPAETLDRRSHYLNVVGRLKPGVTVDAANADMRRVSETLRQQFPDTNVRVTTVVVPVKDDLLGDTRLELLVLMGAALAVLLIACANLAGLLLSRAAARRSEFAVRAALGATRGRLVRQSIVEGLALSLAGSAVGLLIAKIAAGLIADLAPVGFLPVETSVLNWRLLVFAIVTAGTAALAFSIVPAIQAARESSLAVSQARMRTIVGGDGRLTRDVFVVLQVAAALVLLAGAGLMVRTLANLRAINLGFRPDHLLTLRTTLSPTRYADANRRLGFYNRVVDGVRLLPSV